MADKETEYTIVTQGEGKDDSGTPVFDCKPEEVFLFCGIPGGVHFDILVFGWKRDGKTYLRMRFRNEDSGDVLTGDVASESQLKEMVDNVVESFSEMGNCKFEALWRYGDEAQQEMKKIIESGLQQIAYEWNYGHLPSSSSRAVDIVRAIKSLRRNGVQVEEFLAAYAAEEVPCRATL